MQCMGEFRLREEGITEYLKTAKQPAAFLEMLRASFALCQKNFCPWVPKKPFKSPYSEEVVQMTDEQKYSHIGTENGKTSVPVSEKYMLSIKEAAEYFSIGMKKMRRLAEDNLGRFAVYSGNWWSSIYAQRQG